jgi:hypothetical protein
LRPYRRAVAAVLILLICGGCATVVLPAVGTMATMGIDYTAKNCPRRTFTCELDCVHDGVLEALEAMSMKVAKDEATASGRKIEAQAKGLKVKVEMVRLTETTTKIGVDAAKNIILRDGATAREIVAQVEEALERRGALSAGAAGHPKKPAAAAARQAPRAS